MMTNADKIQSMNDDGLGNVNPKIVVIKILRNISCGARVLLS